MVRSRAIEERTSQWVSEKLAWMQAEMAATTGMRHNRRLELGRLGGGLIATAPQHLIDDQVLATLFHARPPEAHVATELQAIRDGIAHGKRSPLPLPFALPTDHAPLIRDGRPWGPAQVTVAPEPAGIYYDYLFERGSLDLGRKAEQVGCSTWATATPAWPGSAPGARACRAGWPRACARSSG